MKITHKSDLSVIQADDYFPFGLTMNSTSYQREGEQPNAFLYNGKELQDDLDLNWYDYGARMYDASIGRWHVVDPLADSSWHFSPYHFTANNPMIFVDPDGRDFVIWYENEDGESTSFRFNGSNAEEAPKNDFVQDFLTAYSYNVDNGGGDKLQAIAGNSKMTVRVTKTEKATQHYAGDIFFNPKAGAQYENGTIVSPATVLEHEADHAHRFKSNPAAYGGKDEELRAIRNEQKTARANGEIPANGVTRTRHEGVGVITYGPKSNKIDRVATELYQQKLLKEQQKSHDAMW
jgi:RHS repeat-associated protein